MIRINRDSVTMEHWREVNEEVKVTSGGEEIINYIYSFNCRFDLSDLIKVDLSKLTDEEKALAKSEGFEYTDNKGFGLLVEFKTSRGDIFYRTGALLHD